MSRCRSCGAEVIWTETEAGKRMPVDAIPNPEGTRTFVLRARPNDAPLAISAWPAAMPGEDLYESHFATCPDAGDWRKGKTAA